MKQTNWDILSRRKNGSFKVKHTLMDHTQIGASAFITCLDLFFIKTYKPIMYYNDYQLYIISVDWQIRERSSVRITNTI